MKFSYEILPEREASILDEGGWQIGLVAAGTFEIYGYLSLDINDWKSLLATVEQASIRLCE
jgi:hypothetical protein